MILYMFGRIPSGNDLGRPRPGWTACLAEELDAGGLAQGTLAAVVKSRLWFCSGSVDHQTGFPLGAQEAPAILATLKLWGLRETRGGSNPSAPIPRLFRQMENSGCTP